jgi:hypothetical protein
MKSASQPPVRVVIAFRAHEPVCGRRLVVSPLGRLVAVAEALDVPIGLALSNELAHQLARDLPETFRELKRGYAERRLVPIYTPAHATPASLVTGEELVDELRLNHECVHGLLGAPGPRAQVAVGACDEPWSTASLRALEAAGFALVVTAPGADRPSRVGQRLVGAPRVAMELWPDRELSAAAVARVVGEAAPGALLLFVHRLADVEAARRAWGELRADPRVELVAPDALAELSRPASIPPRLRLPPSLTPAPAPAGPGADPFPPTSTLAAGCDISGLTGALDWLVDALGLPRTAPLAAATLFEDDYFLDDLPPRAQAPLRLRLVKAGAAFGLEADERLARRPFAEAARLCALIAAECNLTDAKPTPRTALRASVLAALDRLPSLVLDPRLTYRHAELERLRTTVSVVDLHTAAQKLAAADPTAEPLAAATEHLDAARAARWRAEAALSAVGSAHAELRRNRLRGRAGWRTLAQHLQDFAAEMAASLAHLERAAAIEPAFEPTLDEADSDATIWPPAASNLM